MTEKSNLFLKTSKNVSASKDVSARSRRWRIFRESLCWVVFFLSLLFLLLPSSPPRWYATVFFLWLCITPPHLLAAAPPRHTPPKPLRHSRVFAIPLANTEAHLKSPILQACHLFNSLPHNIRSATSYQQFMSLASPHFLSTQCCCSAHIPQRPSLSTSI